MSERRTELQVGVALLAALFILVFGLMWFQEYQLGESYQKVTAHFPAVGGLGVGDPVMVRGIGLGKVTKVELSQRGVDVEMRLSENVVLAEDAVLRLGSAGIMGERMIAVEPGSGRPVDVKNTVFEGRYEAAVTELMGQFEEFNGQLLKFLARADSLMAQAQDEDRLANTLQQTARAAQVAAELLETNRKDITEASESMSRVATRLDRFLTEHEGDLRTSVQGMAKATASIDTLVADMSQVVAGTQEILDALREQKGTAGKLIYDEELAQQVVDSVEMMKFLIEDLRLNPQRYLTVKIF